MIWTDLSPKKICKWPLANREMQIKTTMRYHFIPTRPMTKKTDNNHCLGCGETGTHIHCFWKTACYFLKRWTQSYQGIYPGEMKTYIHTKHVQECLYSFIHNNQKVETTQISINWWMVSKIPYNGILFSNKKDLITDICDNIHECWKHAKSVTKDHILHDSICMKCSEQANI